MTRFYLVAAICVNLCAPLFADNPIITEWANIGIVVDETAPEPLPPQQVIDGELGKVIGVNSRAEAETRFRVLAKASQLGVRFVGIGNRWSKAAIAQGCSATVMEDGGFVVGGSQAIWAVSRRTLAEGKTGLTVHFFLEYGNSIPFEQMLHQLTVFGQSLRHRVHDQYAIDGLEIIFYSNKKQDPVEPRMSFQQEQLSSRHATNRYFTLPMPDGDPSQVLLFKGHGFETTAPIAVVDVRWAKLPVRFRVFDVFTGRR
jgi:hypothetical protein